MVDPELADVMAVAVNSRSDQKKRRCCGLEEKMAAEKETRRPEEAAAWVGAEARARRDGGWVAAWWRRRGFSGRERSQEGPGLLIPCREVEWEEHHTQSGG